MTLEKLRQFLSSKRWTTEQVEEIMATADDQLVCARPDNNKLVPLSWGRIVRVQEHSQGSGSVDFPGSTQSSWLLTFESGDKLFLGWTQDEYRWHDWQANRVNMEMPVSASPALEFYLRWADLWESCDAPPVGLDPKLKLRMQHRDQAAWERAYAALATK